MTETASGASLTESTEFQGRYRLLVRLHEGLECEVWTASDVVQPDRELVVKLVPGRAPESGRAVRLESEFRLLASMRHPGLVRARDFGCDVAEGRTFLVCDRAPGRTLADFASIQEDEAVGIAVDLCRVLSFLHSRLRLHLDVKPKNVLFDVDSGRTTLLDLDLAGFPEEAPGRGTPPYASPEVMGAGPTPDGRSDLYSLGVTLYEILTGRSAPVEILTGPLDPAGACSPWLGELVRDLTAPDPADRPDGARAVVARLKASGTRWPEESYATRSTVLSFPPFMGRRSELERLQQAISPTARRQVRKPVAVVSGPAGVGKSRLIAQVATEWRAVGVRVLRVGPEPGPVGTLQPVRTLLDQLARINGLAPEAAEAAMREGRLGLFDRLAGRLLGHVRRRRTVLVLEDVDRWDRTSRDFVLHFLRRLTHEIWDTGRAPVEIVLSCRSDTLQDDGLRTWLETEAGSGPIETLELAPLSLRETGELLRGLVAPEHVPSALHTFLHERTGGIPLYLCETLIAHPDRPHGSGSLLGALAHDQIPEDAIPRSLEAVVRSRWKACPETHRPLLEVLSIFPNGAEAGVLRALVPDGDSMGIVLDDLTTRGFLIRHGERFHFPNPISRQATLRWLSPERRRGLHDAAVRVLTVEGAPVHEISWHGLKGETPRSTLGQVVTEVPRLVADAAEEEAMLLLAEVAEIGDVSPFAARWANLLLADLHLERGQVRACHRRLDEIRGEGEYPDPALRRRFARLHHREGNLATARTTMQDLLRLRRELSPADRLDILLDLGEMFLSSGRHGEAADVIDQARPLCADWAPLEAFQESDADIEEVRAPRFPWPGAAAASLARFLGLMGDLARHDGDAVLGLRCHLATMKLRSRLGDLVGLGCALHGIGTIYMAQSCHDLAERYYERALNLREEVGDVAGHADTANNMGVLLRKAGRTAEAIDHYRTSLRLRRQIGHAAGEGFSYINIANVYYERRELDAALRYYERALLVSRRLSDARSQAQVLNNLGAVAHLRDRFEEAIGHFEEAERLDRMVGNVKGALVKRLNLAEELARVGLLDRAGRLVETVARAARRRDEQGIQTRILLLRGRIQGQQGRTPAARVLLAEARKRVEGDAEFEAEIAVEQAKVELQSGRPESASELLPESGGSLSHEARAELAVARARVRLALDEKEGLDAAFSEVSDGERFARRARMPGLEHLCARTLGALRAHTGEMPQALSAYATALESLETVLGILGGGSLLAAYLKRREVITFAEEVTRFSAGLAPAGKISLPGSAGDLIRGVREALFEAGRRVGVQQGVSRKNEEMMRRILEISRTLRSTAPLDELFREVVDGVVEFSGAERAFLLIVDERRRIRIPVARNRGREPIPDPEQQISRKITSEVLDTGRSMRLVDAVGAYSHAESVVNLDLRSIMCAPMLRGKMVVGMLYVDNRSRVGQFTATDQELLDIFAAQAAIALENARLVRQFARDEKIRVMGNLAGGVAHDFNNLLSAILGRAQQLARKVEDEDVLKGLETITKAAQDGSVVVSRLQEFTRTRREGEFRSVNLREVVSDVLEFTRARWEGDALRRGQKVEIVQEVPEGAWVMGDLAELREVFTNLVLNGVAALPDGGTLAIRVTEETEHLVAVVEDTGQGMTEEVRESIFDPYFTTRGTEGSGLGMSIVYNIVLRHQGTIHVESAPGEGTRVLLQLPRAEPAQEEVGEPSEPSFAVTPGRRVLVVEDEPGVRELLRDVLHQAGFSVETAESGPEALKLFERSPTDVVITDLGMVPMTGWDVAREVKRLEPTTPVILVTGWGGEIDRATAAKNRVDLLLKKPFDIQNVVECVQEGVRLKDEAMAGEGD